MNSESPELHKYRLIAVMTLSVFVVLVVILLISIKSRASRHTEEIYLRDLGILHGVEPDRSALRYFLTQELESRKGRKSEEIHAFLATIGGESVTWVESPLQNRNIERVTWVMARISENQSYFAEWILEYDREGRLIDLEPSSTP